LEEYGLWGSSNLTDRDWQLLLTGAREVQYKKGDKILEQGQPNFRLYRIKSGQCRVEKQTESGRVVRLLFYIIYYPYESLTLFALGTGNNGPQGNVWRYFSVTVNECCHCQCCGRF